jgi:hypothetical protein
MMVALQHAHEYRIPASFQSTAIWPCKSTVATLILWGLKCVIIIDNSIENLPMGVMYCDCNHILLCTCTCIYNIIVNLLHQVAFWNSGLHVYYGCVIFTSPKINLFQLVTQSQTLHFPWGVPSGGEGSSSCLLTQQDYITLYSNTLHIPLWTAFKLNKKVCWSKPNFCCMIHITVHVHV